MSFNQFFTNLPKDIQTKIIEEYIKPQIYVDELIREFEKQLLSEECREELNWKMLVDVTGKIIENASALEQMCKNNMGTDFKYYYDLHFIEKVNVSKHHYYYYGKPLFSFCAWLTYHKWVWEPTVKAPFVCRPSDALLIPFPL